MSEAGRPSFAGLKALDFEPPLVEAGAPLEGFSKGTREPIYLRDHLPPITLAALVRE